MGYGMGGGALPDMYMHDAWGHVVPRRGCGYVRQGMAIDNSVGEAEQVVQGKLCVDVHKSCMCELTTKFVIKYLDSYYYSYI